MRPSWTLIFRSGNWDWEQVRALVQPIKHIHRVVPKPPLRCPGCVLGVIVLSEGEPLAQHEVLRTLDQVFIRAALKVVHLEASLIPTLDLWSSARVTIRFLVTSLSKTLFPRLLGSVASIKKSPGC